MADIPPEMMTKDRLEDQDFADHELLYRRFRAEDFDGGEVAPEAFELPDMSVNRQKYGPPRWLLLEDGYETWGVAGFRVQDIPRDRAMLHAGVVVYLLRPEHMPLRYNYPHAEVRIYRDATRICRDNNNLDLLEPEFHIRWREHLSMASRIAIPPQASQLATPDSR
jgi:hypothetical protein